MFEEPQTKRIRREDLYSPPQSPPTSTARSGDSSPQRHHHPDLQFEEVIHTIITPAAPAPAEGNPSDIPTPDHDEYSFPLFSTTTTIRLRSPTPPPDPYALALKSQSRPIGYYIPTAAQLALSRARAAEVAISGESVRACSRSLKYAATGRVLLADGVVGDKRGRKKPGKKRRIHLRKILAKEKALEEARRKSIAGLDKYKGLTPEQREEVAKAERARKNRQKKIREKAKKRTLREMERMGMEKGLG
ncbi:hypothetical protein HOY80DRAFT_1042498 [Tuber brumale]|nr:hypothetical protein HOY80DRAFT_1042498 [Tuber brumale]